MVSDNYLVALTLNICLASDRSSIMVSPTDASNHQGHPFANSTNPPGSVLRPHNPTQPIPWPMTPWPPRQTVMARNCQLWVWIVKFETLFKSFLLNPFYYWKHWNNIQMFSAIIQTLEWLKLLREQWKLVSLKRNENRIRLKRKCVLWSDHLSESPETRLQTYFIFEQIFHIKPKPPKGLSQKKINSLWVCE